MKREILFRGKCPVSGEWFFGFYFIDGFGNHCITDNKCNLHEVDPTTVGQYTGLTDENGVKIFEGDVLEVTYSPSKVTVAEVIYDVDRSAFVQRGYKLWNIGIYNNTEVTGNIHETK